MMRGVLLAAGLSLACLGPAAATTGERPSTGGRAETGSGAGAGVWQQMESNGQITVADIRDRSGDAFRALDQNGDGVVTETELLRENLPRSLSVADDPGLRRELFGKIDADGNGAITAAEWRQALDRDLGMADLDDDGRVTLGELARVDAGSAFLNMLGL